MSTDKKQQLEQKLWSIADTLRCKMDADDFRDYILGFIFYKYLSEKMHTYADAILKPDNLRREYSQCIIQIKKSGYCGSIIANL